jgi:hypothetical protein
MMGSERRGVSICFTTLRAFAGRFEVLNEIALPIVPKGTIRIALSSECLVFLPPFLLGLGGQSDRRRGGLLAETEFDAVGPHAMQNDGEFARHRHTGARHATMFGDLHAPGA